MVQKASETPNRRLKRKWEISRQKKKTDDSDLSVKLTKVEFKTGDRKFRYVPKQRDRPITRLRASKNFLRLKKQH